MKGITTYNEINELHVATGSSLHTGNKDFHCFNIALVNGMVNTLPPFRSDFFTLSLSYGSKNFLFKLNDTTFSNVDKFIICVAPGQISQFEKGGDWAGFCTFFKSAFIQYKSEINFLEEYPFFNIRETNLIPLSDDEFRSLSVNHLQIVDEQRAGAAFSSEIIRTSFETILWKVRRIYEAFQAKTVVNNAGAVIASKFQYLVNKHFIDKPYVEDYAKMLNITPNHLTQTIKTTTGKSAKSIILQRRIDEAKYLLKYTHNDIAEIAYYLNFLEPTHFSAFFKKETVWTPSDYKRYTDH